MNFKFVYPFQTAKPQRQKFREKGSGKGEKKYITAKYNLSPLPLNMIRKIHTRESLQYKNAFGPMSPVVTKPLS